MMRTAVGEMSDHPFWLEMTIHTNVTQQIRRNDPIDLTETSQIHCHANQGRGHDRYLEIRQEEAHAQSMRGQRLLQTFF